MEEKRIPQKGDLIRTPRGHFARVNWAEGGEVGVTYSVEPPYTGLQSMVFKIEEIMVVQRGGESFWGELFKKMTDEELRAELRRERQIRSTPPSQEQVTKRREKSLVEMLKELSEEEIKELKEWKKKGGELK